MNTSTRTVPAIVLTAVVLAAGTRGARAQDAPPPKQEPTPVLAGKKSYSVLLVGNSYLKTVLGGKKRLFLNTVLARLSSGPRSAAKLKCAKKYASNTDLGYHWRAGRKLLSRRTYDAVVLQEHSEWLPRKYAQTLENARRFAAAVRTKGGKVVLFMIWSRKGREKGHKRIAAAYSRLGRELECAVAPIGLAWQRALEQKPGIALHTRDGQHPTLLGTYLNACVLYATLSGTSPEGLGDAGVKTATPEVRTFLQKVAWQTVLSYGKSNVPDSPDGRDGSAPSTPTTRRDTR
jgi:hypothetical protein